VAAGAIAEKYLWLAHGIEIVAFVSSIGSEHLFPTTVDQMILEPDSEREELLKTVTRELVDTFAPVRCPHPWAASRMAKTISTYRDRKDSIGGSITCVIRNCPTGLGEPAFHKLEAMLSFAMMSIPATKGFEIGSGFLGSEMPGSLHNDAFVASGSSTPQHSQSQSKLPSTSASPSLSSSSSSVSSSRRSSSSLFKPAKLSTKTNNSGGVQGGISNGQPIFFRVGFKPPATIGKTQNTTAFDLEPGVLEVNGRHDPCIVPRAVPIVESMAAIVIMDALLAQQARLSARSLLPIMDMRSVEMAQKLEELSVEQKCERKQLKVKWRGAQAVKAGRGGRELLADRDRKLEGGGSIVR
jgi:chorismate synthase